MFTMGSTCDSRENLLNDFRTILIEEGYSSM